MHGTTRSRAESILRLGPDLRFREPGGIVLAENFSFAVGAHVSGLGQSEHYAAGKASAFPSEGGPAVVWVDIPDEIIIAAAREYLGAYGLLHAVPPDATALQLAEAAGWVIQFDSGPAFDALLEAWGGLTKEIRGLP